MMGASDNAADLLSEADFLADSLVVLVVMVGASVVVVVVVVVSHPGRNPFVLR